MLDNPLISLLLTPSIKSLTLEPGPDPADQTTIDALLLLLPNLTPQLRVLNVMPSGMTQGVELWTSSTATTSFVCLEHLRTIEIADAVADCGEDFVETLERLLRSQQLRWIVVHFSTIAKYTLTRTFDEGFGQVTGLVARHHMQDGFEFSDVCSSGLLVHLKSLELNLSFALWPGEDGKIEDILGGLRELAALESLTLYVAAPDGLESIFHVNDLLAPILPLSCIRNVYICMSAFTSSMQDSHIEAMARAWLSLESLELRLNPHSVTPDGCPQTLCYTLPSIATSFHCFWILPVCYEYYKYSGNKPPTASIVPYRCCPRWLRHTKRYC